MRIAFVNRIGWPDEGATALYLTDVAEACGQAGHEVHVVCGEAPYRATSGTPIDPPDEHRGVRYHRVPGRRGRGILDRALASVAFLVRVAIRFGKIPRPDVVVSLTDPPFINVVAGELARRRGARAIVWMMDVFPDVAVAAGVLRRRGLFTHALAVDARRSLRKADAVVVLGPAMRRPMLARGVSRHRLHVIENWAPAEVEEAARRPAPSRPERPFTLMYSGTYGVAHDLGPLLDALRAMPKGASVRLLLQASGRRVDELRPQVQDLPIPVEWREPVSRDRFVASLREGDAHVVCVRPGFERLVAPSKLYAPLALGLPVLLVGPEARRVAPRGVRWEVPAGVPPELRGGPGLAWISTSIPRRGRNDGVAAWRELIEAVAPPRKKGAT